MSASERIAALLDQLPSSPDKLGTLYNLKTLLTSVHPSALSDIVANTSFNVIFECLNTNDSEYLEVCCTVLSILLGNLEPEVLLTQFHDELLHGLGHHSHIIRHLCVQQILSATEKSPQQVAIHGDLIVQQGVRLGDESIVVAKDAGDTLVKLGESSEGVEALFEPAVVDKLYATMQISDTVRFHVFQVMVRVACTSTETLNRCSERGFLQQLVNEVYKDDLLGQLNAIELLKDMALTPVGLNYLEQQGVIGKLQAMIVSAETDTMTGFLLPGLVKFFGNVAHLYPKEVCGRFQDFVGLLFRLLHHPDISLVSLAMETLGVIGNTIEGKQALEKLGPEMNGAMRRMGEVIHNAPTETRVKVLAVVSSLLTLQVAEQNTEMTSLTEEWFRHLHAKPMEMLLNIASQPFTELRCGALDLFNTLANVPWGQQSLNNYPGFNEYLLDRSTEKSKEGKDAKFAIVKTLAESPTVVDVFGAPYMMHLKRYQNDGPYFVKVEAAVAFEEA